MGRTIVVSMTRTARAILAASLAWLLCPAARQSPVAVVFETAKGAITIDVDLVHAPVTGANFLKYVDGHFYDGGAINRAVRPDNTTRHDVEIQVIQFQINPARERDQFPPIPLE